MLKAATVEAVINLLLLSGAPHPQQQQKHQEDQVAQVSQYTMVLASTLCSKQLLIAAPLTQATLYRPCARRPCGLATVRAQAYLVQV